MVSMCGLLRICIASILGIGLVYGLAGSRTWSKPLPGKVWAVAIGLIVLGKFLLTSGNEVIAVSSDANGYVHFASLSYYLNAELPFRPVVFPLWLTLTSFTGVPLRFIMEGMHCLSCGILVYALLQWGVCHAAGLLIFFLMIFHRFSFGMLNTTSSKEPFR